MHFPSLQPCAFPALPPNFECYFLVKEFSFLREARKATFDKGAASLLTQFCDKCALSTAHRHFPFAYLYFQQNPIEYLDSGDRLQ